MTRNRPVASITPLGRPRLPALPALTGVRFLAALHVVLFHYGHEAFNGAPRAVQAILATGPAAVGLFYVLSGAVLVYSCTGADGALSSTREGFWRARFARIYPVYLFALILDAPFFVSGLLKTHGAADAWPWGVGLGLAALVLAQAWTPLTVFAWNTPGWSLSVEAFFYGLFPSLVRRIRCQSTGDLVRYVATFFVAALIPPLVVTAVELTQSPLLDARFPAGAGGLDVHTWIVRFLGFSPIARLPEFLIGIAVGHWLRARAGRPVDGLVAGCLEAVAVLALGGALVVLGSQPQWRVWLDSGILSPIFALLVIALASGTGPFARLLSVRPLQRLGDASYALYILQEPVLIWMSVLPVAAWLSPTAFIVVFIGVLVTASLMCQRLIAEPARVWLLAFRQNKSGSATLALS